MKPEQLRRAAPLEVQVQRRTVIWLHRVCAGHLFLFRANAIRQTHVNANGSIPPGKAVSESRVQTRSAALVQQCNCHLPAEGRRRGTYHLGMDTSDEAVPTHPAFPHQRCLPSDAKPGLGLCRLFRSNVFPVGICLFLCLAADYSNPVPGKSVFHGRVVGVRGHPERRPRLVGRVSRRNLRQ